MLSSFSAFFSPAPEPTRFESCVELKKLASDIEALRNKERELKNAAYQKSSSSLDFRKHLIISKLLAEINEKIAAFNDQPFQEEDDDENINVIIRFVKELAEVVNITYTLFNSTLSTPRNSQRETLGNTINCAIYGTAIVGGIAAGSPLLGLGGVILAARVSDKAMTMTGLDNQTTASLRILNELSETLNNIGLNLGLAVNWNRDNAVDIDKFPEEFLCLITHAPLVEPVICTLDGMTYEKKAIAEWLANHRNSPYNRVEMREDQSIEEVLIPNRNLKTYMDRFREENPKLFDEDYSSQLRS